MGSPLSTSVSKTWQAALGLSLWLRWLFVALLGVRLLIGLASPYLERMHLKGSRDDIAKASAFLRSAEKQNSDVRVAFIGSSRFQSAISVGEWARLEALDEKQVLNLSFVSAGPWEYRHLLRRSGGLPYRIRLAVIEIEPWMFNRNRHDWLSQLFQQSATLGERLSIETSPKEKLKLMGNYCWPLCYRRPLEQWTRGIASLFRFEPTLPNTGFYRDPEHIAALAADQGFMARNIVKQHNSNYAVSYFQANIVKELALSIASRGVNVLLVQPPAREEYWKKSYEMPAFAQGYAKVKELIAALSSPRVKSVMWETPGGCGLEESSFIDYGHFNERGRILFTRALFEARESFFAN